MPDTVSKSWFAVLANPDHSYSGTPQDICEQLRDAWVGTSDTIVSTAISAFWLLLMVGIVALALFLTFVQ